MTIKKRVIISYAFNDNLPVQEGEHGWVENFHNSLEKRLKELSGKETEVKWEKKLKEDDTLSAETVKLFPKTDLMITILSPTYIESEWCTRELSEFDEAASGGTGKKRCKNPRIFKLHKKNIQDKPELVEIAKNPAYKFYKNDPGFEGGKEATQSSGGQLEQIYWARLDDIAHDICDLLEKIKKRDMPYWEVRSKIYLAETGPDLASERERIRQELISRKCEILPDRKLSTVESKYKKEVGDSLECCVMSIHLVGGKYGTVPDGFQESIEELQYKLARKKSDDSKLPRLSWISPYKEKNISFEQKDFITLVEQDLHPQAEWHGGDIAAFTDSILDKLDSIKNDYSGTVYLAETVSDLEQQRESLKRRLNDQGYRVLPEQPLPLNYPELLEKINEALEHCKISIHLLGEDYGIVPEKTGKSIIFIQNKLAKEKSSRGKLHRFVRTPPTGDKMEERQRSFIDSLKAECPGLSYNDIFEAATEDMETTILKKIKDIIEEPGGEKPPPPKRPQIYLICDSEDRKDDNFRKLRIFLYKNEFDVKIPTFGGKEEDNIRQNRENLESCDAVVIYYGAGSDFWFNSKYNAIEKIKAGGGTRRLLHKAVFLAPPAAMPKEDLRLHDWQIINGLGGMSPEIEEYIDSFVLIVNTMAGKNHDE
ncbi:MAG: DUF4062 domain-containing protein [Candidatus Aminicenantes bacterium]|nr:DUF4062 domain-containing protein [Candidatus Aminicenantes bacterium]